MFHTRKIGGEIRLAQKEDHNRSIVTIKKMSASEAYKKRVGTTKIEGRTEGKCIKRGMDEDRLERPEGANQLQKRTRAAAQRSARSTQGRKRYTKRKISFSMTKPIKAKKETKGKTQRGTVKKTYLSTKDGRIRDRP